MRLKTLAHNRDALILEAALAFLLTGPSRLAALGVNWLHSARAVPAGKS